MLIMESSVNLVYWTSNPKKRCVPIGILRDEAMVDSATSWAVDVSSKQGGSINMTTNAFRLKECIGILKKYPLDTITVSRHRAVDGGIKGVPGDNELKAIIACLPTETELGVNCVVRKDTDFDSIISASKDMGFSGITFLQETCNKNVVTVERFVGYIKNGRRKTFARASWCCHCESYSDPDGFWVRAKHASLPRIERSSRRVANQFTLHSDGMLGKNWLYKKDNVLLEGLR